MHVSREIQRTLNMKYILTDASETGISDTILNGSRWPPVLFGAVSYMIYIHSRAHLTAGSPDILN